MRSLAVVALVALLASLPQAGLGAPPGPPTVREVTLEAVAVACDVRADGVCLAYNGIVPGPTLDVNLGDTVVVTLVNRIAETAAALGLDEPLASHLAAAPVSFHVHGTVIPATEDGIAAHAGTQFAPSFAPPGGTFTHRFRAAYPGTWHYHDHVLGHDGAEGAARGLYGSLVVRTPGETRPAATLDLHLDDAGPNSGRGLAAPPTIAAGDAFEILTVGLGNNLWTVMLEDPDGLIVGTSDLGPGISERITVAAARSGTYVWRAQGILEAYEGEVVVS